MKLASLTNINAMRLNPNWLRVGILPYCIYKNKIYLLLGIYQVSSNKFEICALSGGYKRTIEDIEDGAFREFNEETEEFFSSYEKQIKQDIRTSPIIYSTGKNGVDRILFLLNITDYINKYDLSKLKEAFKVHFKNKTNTELYGIDLFDIKPFVNGYCPIDTYKDLVTFMKKNNIYKNGNLETYIRRL